MITVCDLGGVAARFRPDVRLAALADRTGIAPDEVDRRIWRSGLDDRASRGELSLDETYTAVLDALQGRLDRDELRALWALAFEPDLQVLQAHGGGALLTNNGPILEDCLAQELAVIGESFPTVLCSWRLGAMKPDRAAFDEAASRLDARPGDLLLIDDDQANVEAARAAGWQAEHHEA